MKLAPKDRIIFALDVPTTKEAVKYIDLLKDHVGVFKIGLELFVAEGPRVVEAVRERMGPKGIFLDMKFHDIPATVKGAMKSASKLGAKFVTVHCDEGRGLLKAVVEGNTGGTKVLGVTVLTSLSAEDMHDAGIDPKKYKTPADLVLKRSELAKAAGCAGVVCSGQEAAGVRKEFGEDFIIVTPGIRGPNDPVGDQKRVATPYEAITNGADYIVVGRPIRQATDPVKAASAIAAEIERAVKDRGTGVRRV
ncbi:MAG: orotidine-5'-phosphate decarboxylase [Deltaproteobacteria bacterium]|nr:orotidine-5'-phosphate decarboxylase [Deltaproteobacteria bacterium]